MKIKTKGFAQITLDDDYIIRDNKPDVVRVIYTHGEILQEDTKVSNGNAWVTGKLRFQTLYRSDDESRRLDSVTGEIPFQEKLVMDDLEDGDDISVSVQIEDLSVGIINSRKLVVRGVLGISAKCMEEPDCCTGYEIPADKHYEKKTVFVPMMTEVCHCKDVLRLQKEIVLPSSRGNIASLLFSQVDLRNEEIVLGEDKATVSMDAQVVILYQSESNGDYEGYEATVPLSGMVELNQVQGDEVFWGSVTPMDIMAEPRGDYDGESRMLGLELTMAVDMRVYREEEKELLLDVYSLEHELEVETRECEFSKLLVKNLSKVRLIEQLQLEPNQERILQICGASGNITVDRVEKRENGVLVEGVLTVHILYNTTEDSQPYAHSSGQIAFEQFVEVAGLEEDTDLWMDVCMEQLQVNLLDSMEYEVKASLQVGILAMNHVEICQVIGVEEKPLDMDALLRTPGMIGYVRREGEDLWDIAKRYHATKDNIIEMGDKVLVVKQVK